MKITKQYLIGVIKEELSKTLNEDGPVRMKKHMPGQDGASYGARMIDYGEAGGLDDVTPEEAHKLNKDIGQMYDKYMKASEDEVMKLIDGLASSSEIDPITAMMAYRIARRFDATLKHYKEKIEGGPSGFRGGDFFTMGGGDVNLKKIKELYPNLMAAFGGGL